MAYAEYEILRTIIVFPAERGSLWHKELNLISWRGMMPKYDLRSWTENREKMTKGITLTKEQMEEISITFLKQNGYEVKSNG